MSGTLGRTARALAAGAAATALVRRALEPLRDRDPDRWVRTNHRGEPVTLLEGPAVVAGLVAGSLAVGGRRGLLGALAAAGAGAFGLVDDLSEDAARARKGLRGHLGALAHGELTTGGLKVLGIGATGLVVAAAHHGRGVAGTRGSVPAWLTDVVTSGALVAASANLLNLLDLRPGRALKAGVLAAVGALGGSGAPLAAATVGAAGAALPADLAERDMLGDGGANALGAVLGTACVVGARRPVRLGLLAGAVGLTLASERVSFSAVIARTPVLRELDAWGRR